MQAKKTSFVLDVSENLGLILMLDCGFILCTGNIKENYKTQQECSFMGEKNKSNN